MTIKDHKNQLLMKDPTTGEFVGAPLNLQDGELPDGEDFAGSSRRRPRRAFNPDGLDYRFMVIAPKGGEFPDGTLLPVPSAPWFKNQAQALNWLRRNSHEVVGMQVLLIKACSTHRSDATQVSYAISTKPKFIPGQSQ